MGNYFILYGRFKRLFTTMTKEKIKELLLSRDKELRLLGLSYLNEDKKSPELWINARYMVSLSAEPYGFNILFKDLYAVISVWSYERFSETYLTNIFSKILTPYINYCYK